MVWALQSCWQQPARGKGRKEAAASARQGRPALTGWEPGRELGRGFSSRFWIGFGGTARGLRAIILSLPTSWSIPGRSRLEL